MCFILMTTADFAGLLHLARYGGATVFTRIVSVRHSGVMFSCASSGQQDASMKIHPSCGGPDQEDGCTQLP